MKKILLAYLFVFLPSCGFLQRNHEEFVKLEQEAVEAASEILRSELNEAVESAKKP